MYIRVYVHAYNMCMCVCVCVCVINLWNEKRIHLSANQWMVWENKFWKKMYNFCAVFFVKVRSFNKVEMTYLLLASSCVSKSIKAYAWWLRISMWLERDIPWRTCPWHKEMPPDGLDLGKGFLNNPRHGYFGRQDIWSLLRVPAPG